MAPSEKKVAETVIRVVKTGDLPLPQEEVKSEKTTNLVQKYLDKRRAERAAAIIRNTELNENQQQLHDIAVRKAAESRLSLKKSVARLIHKILDNN